jgi:hypothetical protein
MLLLFFHMFYFYYASFKIVVMNWIFSWKSFQNLPKCMPSICMFYIIPSFFSFVGLSAYFHASMLLSPSFSYGARLTGGGWGGSCFALTNDFFTENDAELIAQAYYDKFKNRCKYYSVSAAQGAFIHSV